ncbi:acetyl-CoA carboxylase biotin carboxylase subunit [bacterium]|nr:acetyl-CoA carboxylase biotin carboxylase subunit [bacterium]
MKKVLIANRGEIALRVIRACKELGYETVAVYSEADRECLHVRFADEAVCIGPAPASESYLAMPRIIAAAEITNADAVHPGYGFLAENARFAEICERSGLIFIGPTSKMIAELGDKIAAKSIMKEAGVPVIPGSKSSLESVAQAISLANDTGYPVIVKAAAGGGGKGMRIARNHKEMESAFQMASAEARASFSNATLYLERYFEAPRHVEVQILGDGKGHIMALGERDCSIQRKHQKLIEESPSPAVDSILRQRMIDSAVAGAKAIDYRSAGTVEFLLDKDGSFYFMEMNTRIQVEHPVTEMVYGIDIVKEQLKIAAGNNLEKTAAGLAPKGHAIECRINAEDPAKDFRPMPGRIENFHVPGGYGIRVDTHAYAQYVVPPYYDSLIAKIISHGRDREEAIDQMLRALSEFIIEGIPTTIPFHQQLLSDARFQSGNFDTNFLETWKH